MTFQEFCLVLASGMLLAFYLEHRGLNDMKWFAQRIWQRWKEKK